MEDLPEALILDILKRIKRISDRNSLSLVSKRLFEIEAEQREFIRVGCGLHPATESLVSLCTRFPNITKMEITYSGWVSKFGRQLNNPDLVILSSHCPSLTNLTLSFCTFITDVGLSYLSSCEKLRFLELNFVPVISSNGILSIVVGCKNLSVLHLIRCQGVKSFEWLVYLGKLGSLEELAIRNCGSIGEDDLAKLGPGWKKLKCLEFEAEMSSSNRQMIHGRLTADQWHRYQVHCKKLKELTLVNCVADRLSRGLSRLLGECEALEKLHLDMCIGVKDSDLIALAQTPNNLRSISIHLPSQLTDEVLKAFSRHCCWLQEVELSFSGSSEDPPSSSITQNGVLMLLGSCPIRVLVLDCAMFFNDSGMEALVSVQFLETLEVVECQEVSDMGMELVIRFPRLTDLRIVRCLGVTNRGLKPLVGSKKLRSLTVTDCPQISRDGVQGAARNVFYKQDLSWLYGSEI